MKITKFGHSCLLIEEGGVKILIDPGAYSTMQNYAKNVDAILITHEHGDHFNLDSLEIIINNNPGVKIYTNSGVGKILQEKNIKFELLEDGQKTEIKGVVVEGVGKTHALIYPGVPSIKNTGYFITNRLFCPGDALTNPNRPVEILALLVNSPWLSTVQAIDYAKKIKPKISFPVHDGQLKITTSYHKLPETQLSTVGIKWVVIKEGETMEF